MTTPAESTIRLDTADLDDAHRAVLNYVLQAREYLQLARVTIMDASANEDINTDTVAFTTQVVDAIDRIFLEDVAAVAGIELPEGYKVEEAYDVTEEGP